MWILNQVSQKIASPHKSAGGIPDDFKLVNDTKLPDPFYFPDGTRGQSSDDWKCRRQQTRNLSCDTN